MARLHNNNWLNGLKVQTTIKDDCSIRVFDYYWKSHAHTPLHYQWPMLYNYVVNQYEGVYAIYFFLHGLMIDYLEF